MSQSPNERQNQVDNAAVHIMAAIVAARVSYASQAKKDVGLFWKDMAIDAYNAAEALALEGQNRREKQPAG